MRLKFITFGKTTFPFAKEGMELYEKRISHFVKYERIEIPDIKGTSSLSPEEVKEREGEAILKKIHSEDEVILLDEHGKSYTSLEWADILRKKMDLGTKDLVFVTGGAYGFSQKVYERADSKLSLSKMTFSHQIIRLFFCEQLYRALTIIKGIPYHNE